jgi:hypothetical protein
VQRALAAVVLAPADVLGPSTRLELAHPLVDRLPGQRRADRAAAGLHDLRQPGEPAVVADQRSARRGRRQRRRIQHDRPLRPHAGHERARRPRRDLHALGGEVRVAGSGQRRPAPDGDDRPPGLQRAVGGGPDADEARQARLGLQHREVVAGVAGDDAAVQHGDAGADAQRARAPDAVRGGEDQAALGVDHGSRAPDALRADARRDRHHAQIEALGRRGRRRAPQTGLPTARKSEYGHCGGRGPAGRCRRIHVSRGPPPPSWPRL